MIKKQFQKKQKSQKREICGKVSVSVAKDLETLPFYIYFALGILE